MTPLRALREAVAQHRTASAATDESTAEQAGDRAQDYFVVALLWAVLAIVVLVLAVLAGRCFAEAVGGFAGASGDLAAWVAVPMRRDAWTAGFYGLTWALASLVLYTAAERFCGAMLDGLDGRETPPRSPWWKRKTK